MVIKKYKKMKRILIIIGGVLLFLIILAGSGVYLWIDMDVRKNIQIAKSLYPGTAEDALIAYLLDSTKSANDRTHVAVWTLGQIHSQKGRPILLKLYQNDPEGLTCKGKHHLVLCQYGIYKALRATESTGWPLHARLNK